MKRVYATAAVLLSCLAGSASAQDVIVAPPGGIAIVNGGHYAAGTTFVNGMAYPAGAVVQASAVATPAVTLSQANGYTYSSYPRVTSGYSYYPNYGNRFYNSSMIGVGYGNGYGQFYGFDPNYGQNQRYGWNPGYYGGNSFNSGYGRYNTGYGGFNSSYRGFYGGGRRR